MKKIVPVILLCAIILLFAPWIGSTARVDLTDFIFWQLRAPRVLTGMAAGATLGITGAAFQALFGNPLATPSTTGTTAGASLGALCAILLFPTGEWFVTLGFVDTSLSFDILKARVPLFAFVGAMGVSIPIALLTA